MISTPVRVTEHVKLPNEAKLAAHFESWGDHARFRSGFATVYRVPLCVQGVKTGTDAYILHWGFNTEAEWEATTLNGKEAIKACAQKMGWSL